MSRDRETKIRRPTARSRLLPTAALAAILAACGGNETGPADAVTDVAKASAAGPASADCEGVAYWDDDAVRTPMTNWTLRYGAACPTIPAAAVRCFQLVGVTVDEKAECVTENVAMAPESCPAPAREAYLDAFARARLADHCRAATRTAVHDVLAAHSDALPPDAGNAIAEGCIPRARSPADAERCAADHVRHRAAARSAVDEALAEYADRLPAALLDDLAEGCIGDPGADAVESAVRCAVDDAVYELARAELRRETTEAARTALLERVPPEVAEELLPTCTARADSAREGAACGARLGDAKRDLLAALAPLPGDARRAVVDACLREPGVVDSGLRIPDPACAATDAAAHAAVHDESAGYSAADIDACRKHRRWSDAHDCVRWRWLTDERIAAIKAEALPQAAARIEPAYVRPAVILRCDYQTGRQARYILNRFPFLAAEHASETVRRRMDQCVDGQAAGYREVGRLARRARDDAFEPCVREVESQNGRHDWRRATWCLHQRAERAGDDAFVALLDECRPWNARTTVDDVAACTATAAP